jgi:hypothetical protein
LPNRCAVRCVTIGSNIFDPQGDNVATAKLAIDRQILHCKVAGAASDLELLRIDQTCLGRSGGLAPVS